MNDEQRTVSRPEAAEPNTRRKLEEHVRELEANLATAAERLVRATTVARELIALIRGGTVGVTPYGRVYRVGVEVAQVDALEQRLG